MPSLSRCGRGALRGNKGVDDVAVAAWAQEPIRFTGSGSWVQAQRFSWSMWYPWPPFHQDYTNEPGVHLHFAQADIRGVVTSIEQVLGSAVAAMAAALGPVGPVFSAFAAIVGVIAAHLAINNDGSVDIYMSAHGFDVGNLPAADPNVWLDGAWAPVAGALNALGAVEVPAEMRFAVPHPNAASRGKLTAAQPL